MRPSISIPSTLADPFPFYEWARRQAPVFFSPELNISWSPRYADIKAVFDDWKTFSSENAQAPLRPIGEEARRIMREGGFTAYSGLSARVPPDHTRIRKLVQGCFGVRRFRAIEPQIREIVTKAIDAIIQKRRGRFLQRIRLRRAGAGAVQARRRSRCRCPEGQVLGLSAARC